MWIKFPGNPPKYCELCGRELKVLKRVMPRYDKYTGQKINSEGYTLYTCPAYYHGSLHTNDTRYPTDTTTVQWSYTCEGF